MRSIIVQNPQPKVFMLFEPIPIAVFVGIKNDNGEILAVKRNFEGVDYTGLPGGLVLENEGFNDCGLRVLRPISQNNHIPHKSTCVVWTENIWDGQRTNINVITFPEARFFPINGAFWVSFDDDSHIFDMTVRFYKPVSSKNPPIALPLNT